MDEREHQVSQRSIRRRRNELILKCIIVFLLIIVMVLTGLLIREMVLYFGNSKDRNTSVIEQNSMIITGANKSAADAEAARAGAGSDDAIRNQAAYLAAQYDYASAIDLLKSQPGYASNTEYQEDVAGYEQTRSTCVSYPVDQITHVFFHTLVKDDVKAFDGDDKEAGYNQVMTTISEFNGIIEQMYERGYVMVSPHDMCQVNEDGTVAKKEIRLPVGKKPFVLSQDDVSYYHYMDGDGFAEKLIIDENGKIKNTYIEDDGSISIGDYDMVPLIDTFVEEHPDFAYHGHKGVVALTGYEGVMGYRTDEVYLTRDSSRVTRYQQEFFDTHPDFDWQSEVDQATEVASAMRAEGWEFASHTWGHINPLGYGYNATVQDTERWLTYVSPIVGGTDILIFAFGADIGDWQPYTWDNSFYAYFKEQGFNIYCNVDSSQYWVQFGNTFMRQGRRNLDGYRMYYNPEMLSDLFDVETVWDDNRPTPVPPM